MTLAQSSPPDWRNLGTIFEEYAARRGQKVSVDPWSYLAHQKNIFPLHTRKLASHSADLSNFFKFQVNPIAPSFSTNSALADVRVGERPAEDHNPPSILLEHAVNLCKHLNKFVDIIFGSCLPMAFASGANLDEAGRFYVVPQPLH